MHACSRLLSAKLLNRGGGGNLTSLLRSFVLWFLLIIIHLASRAQWLEKSSDKKKRGGVGGELKEMRRRWNVKTSKVGRKMSKWRKQGETRRNGDIRSCVCLYFGVAAQNAKLTAASQAAGEGLSYSFLSLFHSFRGFPEPAGARFSLCSHGWWPPHISCQ